LFPAISFSFHLAKRHLAQRLHKANVSGRMFKIIQSLYLDCSFAVLTDAGLTDWFKVNKGTRQGAISSPFPFSPMISPQL
jgi:hypothetical protein